MLKDAGLAPAQYNEYATLAEVGIRSAADAFVDDEKLESRMAGAAFSRQT